MSQLQSIHASPVALPPIAYKGVPVVTTEMLAQAYECDVASIRKNFSNNRERFAEGKHFYTLANGDLTEFRLCVNNVHAQISPKIRNLTLWLERGAARHAKMLNTDRAWDVFEMLEETFFRVVRPEPEQRSLPAPTTPSTIADRKPLEKLVKVWCSMSSMIHAQAWTQVNAHFNLNGIAELPLEWIPDALTFVQERIDALQRALPEAQQAALPPAQEPKPEPAAEMPPCYIPKHKTGPDAFKEVEPHIIEMQNCTGIIRDRYSIVSAWISRKIHESGDSCGDKRLKLAMLRSMAYQMDRWYLSVSYALDTATANVSGICELCGK